MTYKLIPLLILLSGCSYAYTAQKGGEWVGDPATLEKDTAECMQAAANYMEDIGYARGFGGNGIAHNKMRQCMTQKGYVWRKTP